MVEILVEVAFDKFIVDELDNAQARQRVSKRLFAKHSVSQIEMPPMALETVIVE